MVAFTLRAGLVIPGSARLRLVRCRGIWLRSKAESRVFWRSLVGPDVQVVGWLVLLEGLTFSGRSSCREILPASAGRCSQVGLARH